FLSRKVDSYELQDLRAIGTPTEVKQQQTVGEPRPVPTHVEGGPLHSRLRTYQVETWEYDPWNRRGNTGWFFSRSHPNHYAGDENRTVPIQTRPATVHPQAERQDEETGYSLRKG